jgi:purine-binding chemotaxis protein CheW
MEIRGQNLTRMVVFRLLAEECALPIDAVSEILRPQRLTRMPRTPHWVLGVMNLRGRVFPVVDLKRRLGMLDAPADARTRIMVVEMGGEQMGLLVDEVREVFRAEEAGIEETPALAEASTRDYLQGVVTQGERMILLLDLKRLFGDEELGRTPAS